MKESYLILIRKKNVNKTGIINIDPKHENYVKDSFEESGWVVVSLEKI